MSPPPRPLPESAGEKLAAAPAPLPPALPVLPAAGPASRSIPWGFCEYVLSPVLVIVAAVALGGVLRARHQPLALPARAPAPEAFPTSPPPQAPAATRVAFRSEPPGATVTLDGVVLGRTPMEIALPPVRHVVRFTKHNYQDRLEQIFVTVGDSPATEPKVVFCRLARRETGSLMIRVNPWFSQAVVEGRLFPVILSEDYRRGTLVMGDEQHHGTVELVPDGAVVGHKFRVGQNVYKLRLRLVHAEVLLDGQLIGTTPLDRADIPAGYHQVILRRTNFQSHQATVLIKPGQTTRLTGIPMADLTERAMEALTGTEPQRVAHWVDLAHYYHVLNRMELAAKTYKKAQDVALEPLKFEPDDAPDFRDQERNLRQQDLGRLRVQLSHDLSTAYFSEARDLETFRRCLELEGVSLGQGGHFRP